MRTLLSMAFAILAPGALSAQTPATAPPPACGIDSAAGRAFVMGLVHGARDRAPTGGAMDPLVAVPTDSIRPMLEAASCMRILLAVAAPSSGPDTLPLVAIVRAGEAGFVVVRSNRTAGSPHGAMSFAILTPELEVRSYQHLQF